MNETIKTPLFDKYFDGLEQQEAARASTKLILGTGAPDAAAEALSLGSELGIPPQAVQGAPEVFRSQAAQLRATTAIKAAPKLQDWLGADPINGAIAKDDLENLSWFGRGVHAVAGGMVASKKVADETEFVKGIKAGVSGAKGAIVAAATIPVAGFGRTLDRRLEAYSTVAAMEGKPDRYQIADALGLDPTTPTVAFAFMFSTASPEQRQRMVARELADSLGNKETLSGLVDMVKGYIDQAQSNPGATQNFTDIDSIRSAADWFSYNSGQAVPYLAGLAAMGAIAGPVGLMGSGYALGAGDIQSELIKEGMDPAEAAAYSLAGGIPYAALEYLGPAAALTRGVRTKALQGVAESYFKRLGREVPKQAIEEFINEAGQEIIKDFTVAAATDKTLVLNEKTLLKWFNAGMAGAAGGVSFSAVTAAQSRVDADIDRAGAAGMTAERLAEIDKMAGASKVKARSPDRFLAAIEAVGADASMYVSADGLQEYFQAKDIALDDETLAAWGVDPADFAEKLSSGGDIAIPTANYAARISDSEHAGWVRENAVFDYDEMSVADAAEFNSRVRELMDEAAAADMAADETEQSARASDVQIYDQVFSDLRAAGRSPDVAKNEASVWSAFWRTMGERYGADPLELAKSMGVSIRGPQTPEVSRRRGELDVMINTLRSKGDKALKPSGAGILDFVKSLGGVRDRGGDVASMDAPKGLVAETAADIRARESQPGFAGSVDFNGKGRSLDEIGRALIEAGYFPEHMGGADIQADGTVVDEAAIALEAIAEAISGRDRYIEGQGPNQDLLALSEALSERGIDLSLSNDEIVAAMDDQGDGRSYDQIGKLITESAAFKAWFGDSKVVDADGRPLVVYHGTASDFDAFDAGAEAKHIDLPGFYFTPDAGKADDFSASASRKEIRGADGYIDGYEGAQTLAVYLSIKKPVDIDASSQDGKMVKSSWVRSEIEKAQAAGHDGAVIRGWADGSGETQYVAFSPEQIKSVHNRGTFDASDPRILYQDDYRGLHGAPDAESGASGDDVSRGGDVYPEDFYGPNGFRYYADFGNDYDRKIYDTVRRIKGNPDAPVWIYRAIPKSVQKAAMKSENPMGEMMRPGDWVTISKEYAKEHGEKNLGGDFHVAAKRVKARDIFTNGDSLAEWGYSPDGKNSARVLEQTKRGSIVLPRGGLTEGQTVINLFESADLSTFLHESGHFFLEAFTALATSPNAPQAMRDDLAVMHKFLKVEGGASLTVDQHETWARGFEAYLMEGNAPSLELASAFSRFKAWLSRIYRSIAGLNVKLNPQIREVMDRMLATDAEIAAMRDDLGMRPLFSEAPAGMSPADFATYQRIAQGGVQQAEAALLKRTMEKVRRETQAWFKEEKAAVRKEVEASANRAPAYRLVELLANQSWLGDAGKDAPDVRIDRQALVDQFGDGVIEELGRAKLGGKRAIYGPGGEQPGMVAEMFGFSSARDMIEALQNSGKRKDFIDGETDRIMLERHGDPLSDGSIEEAAALAVHSEQQASMVASEARTLAKRLGQPTRDIRSKVFRQRAKAMIGRMSVREASRPAAFLQAERKAARAAEQSFAKVARGGKGVEAALHAAKAAKEKQLLNSFLYQEARAFEAELQRGRERMQSYSKASVRKAVGLSYVDPVTGDLKSGHIEQIDAMLDRFDFRVRSEKQIQNKEKLRDYIDRMIADGRGDELAIDERFMDESMRKHYTRLSVDDLRGLFDTIANIDHIGRRRAALVDRARKRDLNEVASKVSGLVSARFGSGKSDKQSGGARNFFNLLMRVDTISADIDKKEIGVFYDAIKRPIDEGSAIEQRMNSQTGKDIHAIFGVYTSKEKADFNTARVVPGGNGHPWTKQQILALALNTGNSVNRQRILDRKVHETVRLTESQLDATLETLDKRDWDFVQSVWDYVDTFKKEAFDTAERMTGIRPKSQDAESFSNKHGNFRGGYYPIAYDPTKSKAAAIDAQTTIDAFMGAGRGMAAKVGDGFTKSRQSTGGGRSLNYDFSVMMKHFGDTARLIALGEPVQNARRILAHQDVHDAFRDGGVANLHQTLDLFLHDVASGPLHNNDPINGFSRFIKNNFTLSRLAFNFKTVALQITGIGQSAAVIGKMNMLKGYSEYRKHPVDVPREIMAKSAYMAERQTTFQKDIFDQANELRLSSPIEGKGRKIKNEVSKWGFAPMIKVQFYAVDVPTWLGAYHAEIARNGGDDAGAIHFADRMVDRAQGGGFTADRNALERGTLSRNVRQADFVRLWTTLGGYMVTKMNRGYLTAKFGARDMSEADGAAAKVGAAANMATDLIMLYVFEAAMMGIAYSLLADDEDDEDIINFFIKELAGAAVGGVPFVRESVGAFNGYGAGGVLSSALEIPSNIWTQVTQGENDKAFRRSIADAIGLATGMPSTQSMRIIEELIEGSDGSLVDAAIGRNPLAP